MEVEILFVKLFCWIKLLCFKLGYLLSCENFFLNKIKGLLILIKLRKYNLEIFIGEKKINGK